MTTVATRQFRIRGRVQGVGFRYWTQREAQRLGLSGWVRNLPDYSVKAEAAGSDEQLDEFQRWLQHGPPGARVDQLEVSAVDEDELAGQAGDSVSFVILR